MLQNNKALYKITNKINGKVYIGQTIHPDKRWWEHCNRAENGLDNYPIHCAIKKYGKENFDFEILEWSEDYNNRERELIIEFNSLCPNGYNVSKGGSSPVMYGEEHPNNTISQDTVYQIIIDLQNGYVLTDREIAKKHNTTDKIVADINHGYSHRIENMNYPIRRKRGRQFLSEEQVNQIKFLLKTTNLSYNEIGEQFGTNKNNVSQINSGRSWHKENEEYPIRRTKI